MQRYLPFVFFAALLAGCTSSQSPYQAIITEQDQRYDSLQVEYFELQRLYAQTLDTLQFYDDVETGRVYREINRLNDRIKRLEYDLSVSLDGGLTVTTLLADDLFEPATATLTERGAELLAEVAASLREEEGGGRIRIEGHSDGVPVGGALKEQYPSNWELSTARASAVARYLIEAQEMDEAHLEVAGYGSARPVASNATTEGRRQNRRVRIAVLPLPDEQSAAVSGN
jgi:chemotaxis protein MotB